ncbi:histidine kinase dimerization/phospho-acceptor domain-containing protein [Bacteriovorax sp. BAL6_X]|uniref:histidine kinase dimerization/phospho-acceptor domain-containing protein n=1 Tax=Bacteriovorax sp. BAL6_X TaxID=1201290 RepID=UPI000590C9DB|nr:histidine kinase dimerization/phospho-acceptor domain-containing protein [Bacteriovorax sp. BAL6_X]
MSYVILNLRAFELQSHAIVLVPWMLVVFSLISYTVSFRVAFVGILLNSVAIIYNSYTGDSFSGILDKELQVIINQGIPICLFSLVVYYKHIVDREKSKELKRFQKRDAISKMIITLSHEINNPLTVSKLCLSRLKRGFDNETLNRCEKNLDRISKITHIIKDIHDFKEVDYGTNSKMYDLYEAIKSHERSIDDIL